MNFKIKTVSYKGSKRGLIDRILYFAKEIDSKTVFDGFSGTGIVSAMLRANGYKVYSNDLNFSSYIYGKVFLEGYDIDCVNKHLDIMNHLPPVKGWLTENYSGCEMRKVRGNKGLSNRTLGLLADNSMKLDAARDYIDNIKDINDQNKNALIFSTILALDGVFNNSNDQKSSFKEWSSKSRKNVFFSPPTHIDGIKGVQMMGDILYTKPNITYDFAYLDPPYTSGVLYASSYHLNDSVAMWDKPELNKEYAIPRPLRACFKESITGSFYSKKTAKNDFNDLINKIDSKRIVLSYSDAPRNSITLPDLLEICNRHGKIKLDKVKHRICTQYKKQNKISKELNEYFIIIDK